MWEVSALESKQDLLTEMTYLGFLVVGFYLFWQIVYFKDSPLTVIRLVLTYFYFFVLPGYALLYGFRERIRFIYRLVLGTGLGIALYGIVVYYINLLLGLKIHGYFMYVPTVILLFAGIVHVKRTIRTKNKKMYLLEHRLGKHEKK